MNEENRFTLLVTSYTLYVIRYSLLVIRYPLQVIGFVLFLITNNDSPFSFPDSRPRMIDRIESFMA
jgi:hypothetical protein